MMVRFQQSSPSRIVQSATGNGNLNATTMKTTYSIFTLLALFTVGATSTTLGAPTTATNTDPTLRGRTSINIVIRNGIRFERFHYFPGTDIYFSVVHNRYFWYDNGRWRNARQLPRNYRHIPRSRYVVIEARHDRPWTYHEDRWRYDNRRDRWDRRDDRRDDRWDRRYDRRDDRRDDHRDRKDDRRNDRRDRRRN